MRLDADGPSASHNLGFGLLFFREMQVFGEDG